MKDIKKDVKLSAKRTKLFEALLWTVQTIIAWGLTIFWLFNRTWPWFQHFLMIMVLALCTERATEYWRHYRESRD